MRRHLNRLLALLCFFIPGSFAIACDDTSASPDSGTPDADADTDADTDADAGSDAGPDAGAGCTELDYPPGPYAWFLDGVVGDTAFPAIFDGEVTQLVLSEIFCTEIESLVFALGADTRSACPARFEQLGDLEEIIHDAHGELVGLYWEEMVEYANQPLEDVSAHLDAYGWGGGYRIQEDAAQSISSTLDSPPYLFEYLPFVFIVDTSTMAIVASDSGDAMNPISVDVVAAVQAIDADHP